MRLLQHRDGAIHLTGDLFDFEIPAYAVLSHTWGNPRDEVHFKDMVEGIAQHKPGYKKIEFCCEKAVKDGLQYFWVDTCCIDKSSSAELQEAITSMFRWYQQAAKCYVYLGDVTTDYKQCNWEQAFQGSRWFTRGWTLQELLAPHTVEFFSQEGWLLGDKKCLKNLIREITGINNKALKGTPMSQFNTNERLLCAKNRHTTRGEDEAYSLLGIFGISMPVMYGEGRGSAISRLKKEIHEATRRNTEEMLQISNLGAVTLHSAKPNRDLTEWRKLESNRDSLNDLAFSSDGTTLAMGSNKEIALLNWQSGRALRTLKCQARLDALAFSPDGVTLASVGTNGPFGEMRYRDYQTITLWDSRSGVALQTLQCHPHLVKNIAFSPDGTILASGGYGEAVRLWNSQSGALFQTYEGRQGYVFSIAFSSDSTILASASKDGVIILWDIQSGVALQKLEDHQDFILSIAFSPNSMTLASAGSDGIIRLWNSQSVSALQTLKGHQRWIQSRAFSSDDTTLTSAGIIGAVELGNSRSGAALDHTLQRRQRCINSIAFSPDGTTLASAGNNGVINLWNSCSGAALQTLEGHEGTVCQVIFSPDGATLASAGNDGVTRLWR
ncbi:MAG: hypothetical protein Q9157_002686 [Trypethelium eluteriae]